MYVLCFIINIHMPPFGFEPKSTNAYVGHFTIKLREAFPYVNSSIMSPIVKAKENFDNLQTFLLEAFLLEAFLLFRECI